MSDLNSTFLGKLNFENIWIFITEKCNLNCDYCFFSNRKHRKTLEFDRILLLLKALPAHKKYCFVLSGGEPLLCWERTKKLIAYLRKEYAYSSVSLQTNMFFFSPEKARFLKQSNVIIEPGIDGNFLANFRHRKGFDEDNYKTCLSNLRIITRYNLEMNPTMTVHPQETEFMYENFQKLVSLGLKFIEVHPAFMADWDSAASKNFIWQYKKIIDYEKENKRHLVSKNYSVPMRKSIDLIIQPDGLVLPNWTFLAFNPGLRENFFLFRISENNLTVFRQNLINYFKKLESFFKEPRTYRDFSNFNAAQILDEAADSNLFEKFLIYKKLTENIQIIDNLSSSRKERIV